jgi:hypothetical protein
VPLLPCVFGGVKGKSVLKSAEVHTNKPAIFKLDIAHCFPSIDAAKVKYIFQGIGFRQEALIALTSLTTWKNEIPQGVPTSTALANLALSRVDMRIAELMNGHDCAYSRWVDDLTFSGGRRLLKLRGLLKRIVESEGFKTKPEKTETRLAHERQTVTNFVVNKKVNLAREQRNLIKADVKAAVSSGVELSPSLSGKMFWLRSVNPEVGGRLVERAVGK